MALPPLPGITVPEGFLQALELNRTRKENNAPRTFRYGNISFRGLRIDLLNIKFEPHCITLNAIVPDRDTGKPIPLVFTGTTMDRLYGIEDPEQREKIYRECVRDFVVQFISHEVAELLLYKGEREDPHGR